MVYGVSHHQLDGKNRFRVPSKMRAALGEGFVLCKGTSGCLFVFSAGEFSAYSAKLNGVPLGDKAAQKALRAFYSSAFGPETDSQGRAILPAELKEHAGIVKDIVTVGVGTRAEIWSEERWTEYNKDTDVDKAFEALSANYKI